LNKIEKGDNVLLILLKIGAKEPLMAPVPQIIYPPLF